MNDFRILAIQTQLKQVLEDLASLEMLSESNFLEKIKEIGINMEGIDQMYISLLIRVKTFLDMTDNADKSIIVQYGRLKAAIIEDIEECLEKVKYLYRKHSVAPVKELLDVVKRLHATVMNAHFSKQSA